MKYYRVNDAKEMAWLANEMKMDAVLEKQDAPDDYSKTEEEAFERTKKDFPKGSDVPHSAAIMYKGEVYSIVLTCETYEEERWHLSLGKANKTGGPPERADDETSKFITEAFFQGSFEECPPEGAFKNVRHFRAAKVLGPKP
jgi:hypothetical protein